MPVQEMSIKQSVTWGMIAFGIVLAAVVGVRLDKAALTMIVGVACGIGASVPTGFLIVYLLRRRDTPGRMRGVRDQGQEFAHSPPVVVIAPPAAPQLPQPTAWPGGQSALLPAQRRFAVIGEEGLDDDFDY
jgi:hypothetical protein